MKLLLMFIVSTLAFHCRAQFTPYYQFTDFGLNPQGIKLVTMTPQWTINIFGGTNYVPGLPISQRTVSSGVVAFTNTIPGLYQIQFFGANASVFTFTNYFGTNVTGYVNAANPIYFPVSTNISPYLYAYSQAASDSKYLTIASYVANTNSQIPLLSGTNIAVIPVGGSNQINFTGILAAQTPWNQTINGNSQTVSNVFIDFSQGGGILNQGVIYSPSNNTASLVIQGSGSNGIAVTLESTPAGLFVNAPIYGSGYNGGDANLHSGTFSGYLTLEGNTITNWNQIVSGTASNVLGANVIGAVDSSTNWLLSYTAVQTNDVRGVELDGSSLTIKNPVGNIASLIFKNTSPLGQTGVLSFRSSAFYLYDFPLSATFSNVSGDISGTSNYQGSNVVGTVSSAASLNGNPASSFITNQNSGPVELDGSSLTIVNPSGNVATLTIQGQSLGGVAVDLTSTPAGLVLDRPVYLGDLYGHDANFALGIFSSSLSLNGSTITDWSQIGGGGGGTNNSGTPIAASNNIAISFQVGTNFISAITDTNGVKGIAISAVQTNTATYALNTTGYAATSGTASNALAIPLSVSNYWSTNELAIAQMVARTNNTTGNAATATSAGTAVTAAYATSAGFAYATNAQTLNGLPASYYVLTNSDVSVTVGSLIVGNSNTTPFTASSTMGVLLSGGTPGTTNVGPFVIAGATTNPAPGVVSSPNGLILNPGSGGTTNLGALVVNGPLHSSYMVMSNSTSETITIGDNGGLFGWPWYAPQIDDDIYHGYLQLTPGNYPSAEAGSVRILNHGKNSFIGPDGNPTPYVAVFAGSGPSSFYSSGLMDAYPEHGMNGFLATTFSPFESGNGSTLDSLPTAPNEIAVAEKTPPIIFSMWYGNYVIGTNEQSCLSVMSNVLASGAASAITNAGVPMMLFMDANVKYFNPTRTVTNGFPMLTINTSTFPDGTNFSAICHSNGFLIRGNIYTGISMSNTVLDTYSQMPLITESTIAVDVAKLYDFGLDGINLADQGGFEEGTYALFARSVCDEVLNPRIWSGGGNIKRPWSCSTNDNGRGLSRPMSIEMLFKDIGMAPSFAYKQVNEVGFDMIGYFPGFIEQSPEGILTWMSLFRSLNTYSLPHCGIGHFNCGYNFGQNGVTADFSVPGNETVLTINMMSLSHQLIDCDSRTTFGAQFPNLISCITNASFLSMQKDPLCKVPIKLFDNGPTNVSAWSRELFGKKYAVALVNETGSPTNITFNFSSIGLSKNQPMSIFNVWGTPGAGTNIGTFANSFTFTNVPATNVVLLSLSPFYITNGITGEIP
jgi:hypothetical protein